METRPEFSRWEYGLLGTGVGLIAASAGYVLHSYGSVASDAMEILVPLGTAVLVVAFSLRLRREDYRSERTRRIVAWTLGGTVAAALVGGWWVVLYHHRGLPVSSLGDQILTLMSFGVGAGVVAGARTAGADAEAVERASRERPDRTRVVCETVWTGRADPNGVALAVVEAVADHEGVEPTELDFVLYDHVDPSVLADLANHDGSPWQLSVETDRYRILLSSYGTVTVEDRASDPEDLPLRTG